MKRLPGIFASFRDLLVCFTAASVILVWLAFNLSALFWLVFREPLDQ